MTGVLAASFSLHNLWHPLTGLGYQFWSGIGSDFGEASIFAALLTVARHHNCHAKRCLRLGRHAVGDTGFKTCRKHHPTIPDRALTAEEIAEHHQHRTVDYG